MRKFIIFSIVLLFSLPFLTNATTPEIGLVNNNDSVLQGNPLMVKIENLKNVSEIQSGEFLGQGLRFFYQDLDIYTLIGVDLNQKPGIYKLKIELKDGEVLVKDITVVERQKVKMPLGIPEKLGGNTKESEAQLVNSLVKEKISLQNIKTSKIPLWVENFQYPLKNVFVTDTYGYSRQTGNYVIAHKGTDFRASEDTPVYAINRGIVRVTQEGRTYGKTIAVDHGAGIQSLYLHLSKINVKVGELVEKNRIIGLSGQTGYVTAPHLHLSLRINGVSIDPMEFFKIWNQN